MDTQEFKRQCENGRKDFSNAYLKDINLTKIDLSRFIFNGAILNNAVFRESILIKAEFQEATIENASFTGSNLQQANLSHAQIINTDLCEAKITQAKLIKAIITNGSILQNANLSEAQLIGANLTNANLTNANLTNANLTQVQALETRFTNAIFAGTCLKDLHFNHKTNFEKIRFDYFYLEPPHIYNRKLYYSNGRDFSSVYLKVHIENLVENFISQISLKAKLEFIEALLNFIHEIEPKAQFVLFQATLEKYLKNGKLKYKTQDTISSKNFLSWETIDAKNTIILVINEYFKSKNQFYADGKIEINDPIIQTLIKNNKITIIMQTDKQQDNKKYKAQGGEQSQNIAAEQINLKDASKIEMNNSSSSDRNNEYTQEIVDILNRILLEIEDSHDINTTSGKMAIATSAIAKIESDRPLRTKIVSALKRGGIVALEKSIDFH